jgi:hypothetical protein
MNKLQLLKSKLTSLESTKPQINWVPIELPYNLKDTAKIKFTKQLRFDGDINSWVADETIADNFDKVYLEEFDNPTQDQKLLLKQSGCNYCKERKLYYMLKFQTDEEPTEDV